MAVLLSSPMVARATAAVARGSQHLQRLGYLWDLLLMLVSRDMKLRYRRSMLGILWTLLNPLALLLTLYFVFHAVIPLNIPRFTSFLFSGLLAWTWFAASLHQATGAIVDNSALIKRPSFPATILPVVAVTSHLVHFLLAFPVLLLFLLLDGCQITSAILALPLVMALQFIWALSLAYFTAALYVNFRDTQHLLGVLLQLLFYLTPIFYETSAVPSNYQVLYLVNPMVYLIDAYRTILLRGELPEHLGALLIVGLVALGLLLITYRHFVRMSYRFVEEV